MNLEGYFGSNCGLLKQEINHTCKVKIYPCGYSATAASRAIFRRPGWEAQPQPKKKNSLRDIPAAVREKDNIERSRRRAAVALRDLALCNDWTWFVTLTLDPSKVDRYDPKEVTKRLNRWLDNRVRKNGLHYLIVPELHQDGALHYHGLFDDALPVTDSGTISRPGDKKPRRPRSKRRREQWLAEGGHVVYNLPSWSLGFSTAIGLYGERLAAINYVSKYITKATQKAAGRWYYHSSNLKQPDIMYNDMSLEELEAMAADELAGASLGPDQVRQQLGRQTVTVPAVNLTLFTHREYWEDDNGISG